MDICFLTCICLWQISQIQTFLFKVVGPGLVSTSPAFVSSSASHPAGPHGRHAQSGKSGSHCWGRGGSTQFAQQLESAVTVPPLVGCVVWSPLHNINNTVATGFDQPIPPTRTIAVALDMSKAFDTVNIHTLIYKLTHTDIPHTILRYIANYIKGRMAYTTVRNHSSTKRQFKSGVPQGGIL